MIIVSQNKKAIVNFDEIKGIWIDIEKGIFSIKAITNMNIILGYYKTEERAKEVLVEIVDTYKFNSSKAVGQKNAVYKMPEE